jgi:hypothetical protein
MIHVKLEEPQSYKRIEMKLTNQWNIPAFSLLEFPATFSGKLFQMALIPLSSHPSRSSFCLTKPSHSFLHGELNLQRAASILRPKIHQRLFTPIFACRG